MCRSVIYCLLTSDIWTILGAFYFFLFVALPDSVVQVTLFLVIMESFVNKSGTMLQLPFQDRSELLTHYGDYSRIDPTLPVPNYPKY